MMNKNFNTESKPETLYAYRFLMADGTIEIVYAPNKYEAAKLAREGR